MVVHRLPRGWFFGEGIDSVKHRTFVRTPVCTGYGTGCAGASHSPCLRRVFCRTPYGLRGQARLAEIGRCEMNGQNLTSFRWSNPHFYRPLAAEVHEDWLEATLYLNMEHLREHKKEMLRQAA